MTKQVSPGPFLITTAPSLINCYRCKRLVMAATVGGMDVHVDTATLNEIGELAALVSGRRTYHLVTRDYLVRRTAHHISTGQVRSPVLAEHACDPIPDHHVDHAWTLNAHALLYDRLGATVARIGATPPF